MPVLFGAWVDGRPSRRGSIRGWAVSIFFIILFHGCCALPLLTVLGSLPRDGWCPDCGILNSAISPPNLQRIFFFFPLGSFFFFLSDFFCRYRFALPPVSGQASRSRDAMSWKSFTARASPLPRFEHTAHASPDGKSIFIFGGIDANDAVTGTPSTEGGNRRQAVACRSCCQ